MAKLWSETPSEREWASHVLCTGYPKLEGGNLERALQYCDLLQLKERVAFLGQHENDESCGSNCLMILEMLIHKNV